jgi:hypothetical protein
VGKPDEIAKRKTKLDGIYKRMSQELKDKSLVMKLIINGKATLKEMQNDYELDDLIFISACIDVQREIEEIDS